MRAREKKLVPWRINGSSDSQYSHFPSFCCWWFRVSKLSDGYCSCYRNLPLLYQVDAGTSTDAATLTEPDALGPCEPGTAVNLEGIVWHETDTGKKNNNLPGPRRRRRHQLSPSPLRARTAGISLGYSGLNSWLTDNMNALLETGSLCWPGVAAEHQFLSTIRPENLCWVNTAGRGPALPILIRCTRRSAPAPLWATTISHGKPGPGQQGCLLELRPGTDEFYPCLHLFARCVEWESALVRTGEPDGDNFSLSRGSGLIFTFLSASRNKLTKCGTKTVVKLRTKTVPYHNSHSDYTVWGNQIKRTTVAWI